MLSDKDIKECLKTQTIRINPLEEKQIGPASIDLTLSNEWWVFKKKYLDGNIVDLSKVDFRTATQKIKRKEMVLKHNEMCLVKTVEKITLPADILGALGGRSRFARMGLAIHVTSAVVQPGSNNRQILEIVNFAPFPIRLHAGMRVSQIFFHRMESKSSKPYALYGTIAKKQ